MTSLRFAKQTAEFSLTVAFAVEGGVTGRQVAEEHCDTWFIDM
jgi:hypothetical protein